MSISLASLMKATQLTRRGRLMDATRLIQRALGAAVDLPANGARTAGSASPLAARASAPVPDAPDVADVPFRDIAPPAPANDPAFGEGSPAAPATAGETLLREPAPTPEVKPDPAPAKIRPASFRANSFTFAGLQWAYRLFVPPAPAADDIAADSTAAPALIVLLHGCKQDAADFAKGTAMNALAGTRNCLVLYPEQLRQANSMGCWNWFEPAHQSRDAGEPAMIATLTRQVMAKYGVDASRVYVAGLSAGGAMAALVAGLYPDLFAAVGVHSGLPAGAATDVMSAFSAMRRGPANRAASSQPATPMPVIVFHGSADKTVSPDNGEHIRRAAISAFAAGELKLTEEQTDVTAEGDTGRSAVRSVFRDTSGKPYVEYWTVDAGPHAWSGGHVDGSFTDPDGPSASQAMLEFFLQHRRVAT